MDREQYLKQKQDKSTKVSEPQRQWCFTCRRKLSTCLCAHIHSFSTRTIISLLMHPKEAKKQRIGTGYLTKACLKNSRLFSEVNLDTHREFCEFLDDSRYHHVLLYPDSQAWSLDASDATIEEKIQAIKQSDKTLVLHLLDATWPCAKKMMRLSQRLQNMSKATFAHEYRSRFVIKHQPHEACLSTIETTFHCLEGLKKHGLEPDLKSETQNLLTALDALVAFQLKCEHDPNIPSNRGTKPAAKKGLTRSRIRPKKNRLFYWDVEKSPIGTKGKENDKKGY